jgi:hypothetical protein
VNPGIRKGTSIGQILATALLAAVLAVALALGAGQVNWTSCVGDVGFNWPNAGRVYLAGLNQRSTDADQPSRPFALASSQKIRQVRVFVGVDAALSVWQKDPEQAVAGLDRLLADAEAHNVQLIISNYPDQQMINALAGHDYPSWAAAQVELVIPGSVPFRAFEKWLEDVVPRFASDPRIAAWEVVNEPGYMLGMDNGTVDVDVGLAFVEHFSELLHRLGARDVSGGGRPVFDPMKLPDDQLIGYAKHLDILDDHLYPKTTVGGQDGPSKEDARKAVAQTATWFNRVRRLMARPEMPGMLGEVGTQSTPWFSVVLTEATRHGWPVLAWGFDAYDQNDFTETVNPETFDLLSKAAKKAARVNGRFPVVVGAPICRSEP